MNDLTRVVGYNNVKVPTVLTHYHVNLTAPNGKAILYLKNQLPRENISKIFMNKTEIFYICSIINELA